MWLVFLVLFILLQLLILLVSLVLLVLRVLLDWLVLPELESEDGSFGVGMKLEVDGAGMGMKAPVKVNKKKYLFEIWETARSWLFVILCYLKFGLTVVNLKDLT